MPEGPGGRGCRPARGAGRLATRSSGSSRVPRRHHVGVVATFTAADLLLVIAFAGAGVLGYIQGALRQILGLAVVAVAFVLGTGLRQPLGDWFASYWTEAPYQFAWMFAWLISFVAIFVLGMILIAIFYKRSRVLTRLAHADEVLGAILCVVLAVVTAAVILFILDSYYGYSVVSGGGWDVGWLSGLHGAVDDSVTARFMRDIVIPPILVILGPLLPDAVRRLVP